MLTFCKSFTVISIDVFLAIYLDIVKQTGEEKNENDQLLRGIYVMSNQTPGQNELIKQGRG